MAVLVAAAGSAGCSSPSPRPAPGPAPAVTTVAATAPARPSCVQHVPATWSTALGASAMPIPNGTTFGLAAVTADAAYGQYQTGNRRGVGRIDLRTGRLTPMSTYAPAVSGLGALAADGPWVVWEQLDSTQSLVDWSVHAFDQRTGRSMVLATSRLPGGGYVAGEQPLPVLRGHIAAWAQPVPAGGNVVTAEVRAVDLDTGRTRTLDRGRVSSPVYAGGDLVWAKVTAGPTFAFHAVYAGSLTPVTLPAALEHPDSVGYLAGAPGYLAWSTSDSTALRVWQLGSRSVARYASPDSRHYYQFLQLAGDFLVWYSGAASTVLDLGTGGAFDVAGTAAGTAQRIVTVTGDPGGGYHLGSVETAHAPPIPGCR